MVTGIVPLPQCLDRPDEGEGAAPTGSTLAGHLVAVGAGAQALAVAMGLPQPLPQLLRLAGLLHDAGKARTPWQVYVRSQQRRRGSVPHAFWGAAVFFALAWEWQAGAAANGPLDPAELRHRILGLTLDLAQHHGRLGDLEDQPPWSCRWTAEVAQDLDLAALAALLREEAADLAASWLQDPAALGARVEAAGRAWRRALFALGDGTAQKDPRRLIRLDTACLIAADRFAVAELPVQELAAEQAAAGAAATAVHCARRAEAMARQGGSTTAVATLRSRVQEEALARFRGEPHRPLYQLEMPTGGGKTLAALRVALEAAAVGRRRVLYVAPYLAVLSQAAREISRSSGLPVLEHHHLALPEPPAGEEGESVAAADRALLSMASWQAPMVATTFNQLFAAFFPRTAQQTLRLPALREALVVVDEPQVISGEAWPLFCTAAEAAAAVLGTQLVLVSATVPPWQGPTAPLSLAAEVELPPRYRLQVEQEPWGAESTAEAALEQAREAGSAAVILNTIADAVAVYRAAQARGDGVQCLLVHGAMTALHKSAQLRRVRLLLRRAARGGLPVLVVATQVLEAGVDLSFRALLRARPLLPSVVQAAGRANRHAEGPAALVRVFPFVRRPTGEGDGRSVETREWVYRDSYARAETDALLAALAPAADERDLRPAVQAYYRRLLERVPPGLGVGRKLAEVAAGRWSAVAGTAPFGPDVPGAELFVPRDEWNDRRTRALLRAFGLSGAEAVFAQQQRPGFRRRLSLAQARQWSALVHRFTVAVPVDRLQRLARSTDLPGPFMLANASDYSPEVGLGELLQQRGDDALFL